MTPHSPFILLVEPDPFERLQLTRILRDAGYHVTPTEEAEEALDLFVSHHQKIALVLWRARLLGAAGVRLRQSLRAVAPHVPVLALDEQSESYGVYAGHCLDGSSTLEEMLSKVQRFLRTPPTAAPQSTASEDPPSPATDEDAFVWPMPDEELDRLEKEERPARRAGSVFFR